MTMLLEETIDITRSAGQAVMSFYRDSFSVKDKSPDNPVTDADLAADALLQERLTALLPEAGWLSEETADSPERLEHHLVWIVDPIDGTKEFVMGLPEFTISVALVDKGLPTLGIVLNPATGEIYHASRGNGAFLNGRPVSVSGRQKMAGAEIDASRSERKRGEFEPFEELLTLRTMGSIAYKLARVAAGQADATWSRGPKSEWDICAGALLIEEAGGRCVDLDGQRFRFNQPTPKVNGIIATSERLYEPLMALLAPYRSDARTD